MENKLDEHGRDTLHWLNALETAIEEDRLTDAVALVQEGWKRWKGQLEEGERTRKLLARLELYVVFAISAKKSESSVLIDTLYGTLTDRRLSPMEKGAVFARFDGTLREVQIRAMVRMWDSPVLRFRYRNHRGEESDRSVMPRRLWHGSTEWHREPQWLLDAYCLTKNAQRTFAVKDVLEWR